MIVHKSKNCLKCKHMKDCKLSPEGCSQFERVDQAPDKSTNALAELAERLEQIAEVERESALFHGDPLDDSDDISKASRIVTELAKVPDCTFKGNPRVDKSADAVVACRAIAKEGVQNV